MAAVMTAATSPRSAGRIADELWLPGMRLAKAQGTSMTAWIEEMLRAKLTEAGIAVPAEKAHAEPKPPAVLVRFGEYTRLRGSGVSMADTAARMGVSLKTARKYESWIGAAPEAGRKPAVELPEPSSAEHGVAQAVFSALPVPGDA